jgi:predicted O-linked N-acetylglucosamine transferase (SPINDLY family)
LAAELAKWNARFGNAGERPPEASTPNSRDPQRPLRIGWVSPDFRRHPIGRFLLPIFSAHDAAHFPFYCYSDVPAEDGITAALRAHAQQWRATAALSHDELAALIRGDQIDILIDLTMHMQGTRLPVFAQKPAPVQMTYLAYASSTGVPQIDYRLTDIFLDPPGTSSPFVEKPLHLQSYWCYAPDPAAPEVNPLPAAASGQITFGNLNNFCKASRPALAAWLGVLRAVPNSQLLLHAPPGVARDRITQLLIDNHLDPARIRFAGLLPFQQYMQTYHQIDIALDPFPYTGGTTSCDALWMGVPLLTRAGNIGFARSGVSLLSQLGLTDWIATSPEDYVARAARLAQNLTQLAELRAALRPRMLASRLLNASAFAADLQALFRQAWTLQCLDSRDPLFVSPANIALPPGVPVFPGAG